jgi:hypothetical protein
VLTLKYYSEVLLWSVTFWKATSDTNCNTHLPKVLQLQHSSVLSIQLHHLWTTSACVCVCVCAMCVYECICCIEHVPATMGMPCEHVSCLLTRRANAPIFPFQLHLPHPHPHPHPHQHVWNIRIQACIMKTAKSKQWRELLTFTADSRMRLRDTRTFWRCSRPMRSSLPSLSPMITRCGKERSKVRR